MGEWCTTNECKSKYIFHADHTFEWVLDDHPIEISNIGKCKYELINLKGENWVNIIDSKNNSFLRFKYEFDGVDLLTTFYINGTKSNHDIGMIARFKRPGIKSVHSMPQVQETFILPDKFLGKVFIVFEGNTELPIDNNPIIVPENGIVKLQGKAVPFEILKGGFVFKTNSGDTLTQVFTSNNDFGESIKIPNTKCVYLNGFNVWSRKNLLDSFGIENNERNVLFAEVVQ